MTINANKKFTNAITNRLSGYKMISERKITDLIELNSVMETITSHGYSLSIIKLISHLIDASAQEYSYENGLKFLISKITFKKDGNIHTIEQQTLTSEYSTVPIVNIVIEREKKALQQLLISSDSKDDIFPESMKDIEIETTCIYVNNTCGSVFKKYIKANDGSLILEKYKQYYPVSDYEESNKDLLRLCGFGTRDLEIIYNKEEPIFAQLSSEYKVEMADFDPNSAKDAKIIVEKINNEVDSIVANIQSLIDEHDKKHSYVKKLETKKNNIEG